MPIDCGDRYEAVEPLRSKIRPRLHSLENKEAFSVVDLTNDGCGFSVHRRLRANIKLWQAFRSRSACPRTLKPKVHSRLPSLENKEADFERKFGFRFCGPTNKEADFEGKFGFRLCGPTVGGTAQRRIAIDCGDRYEAVEPLRSKIRPRPHSLENKEAFSGVDLTNDGCGFSFHRRLRANINLWQAFRTRSACPRTLKPKIHSRLPSLENKEADFEGQFGFRLCVPIHWRIKRRILKENSDFGSAAPRRLRANIKLWQAFRSRSACPRTLKPKIHSRLPSLENKEADFEGKFGFRLCGPMEGGTAQRRIAIECGDRYEAVEPLRFKIRPQPHSLENKEAFSGVDLTNDGCGFSVHRRLRANIKLWQAFRSRSACPRTLKPKIHPRLPSLENKEADSEGKFGFRLCGPMEGGTAQRRIAIECGRLRANIKLWQAFRSRSACPRTLKPKIHSRLPSLENKEADFERKFGFRFCGPTNKEADFEGKFGFRLCGPTVGGTAQRRIAIDCGDRYEAVEPLRSKIRPQPHSLENKEAFSGVDLTNDGCGFSFHRRLRANIKLWQAFRSRSACPRTLKPKIHSRLPSLENKEADFEGKFGFRLCGPMEGGTAQRRIAIECGDRYEAVEPLRFKIRPQPHSLENKEAFSGVDLTNDGCGFSVHRRLRANIKLWQAFRSRSACPRTLKPKIHPRLPSLENKEADSEGKFGFRLCGPMEGGTAQRRIAIECGLATALTGE
ncbi:hypothetical protein DFH06DRAFT_1123778 [Mycena polygramma]|nr:hypothetical protein DFH06DRAFT_1123778 [Mycena polygramma]